MKNAKNKATKKTVKAVCELCGGTGLCEKMRTTKGELMICPSCDGMGFEEIEYEPFVERKKIHSVKAVHFPRERVIGTGVGKTGKPMTYKEFLSDKWR
jgi:ribosome-binding protein aMBF1 (putative translation factor)